VSSANGAAFQVGHAVRVQRNRLLLLAAAVAVAAIVVVAVILIGGGGDSKSADTPPTSSGATPETGSYLAGVPQHGDTLGAADAPATVTVYEDPQCPFCREWALQALPSVVADYVRPGKVKLVYRGISIIGPDSERGVRAIYAAGAQNELWNLADALYRRQGAENGGWLDDAVINAAAASVGANAARIRARAATPAVTAQLREAAVQARADRVQGTPTFVLSRPPSVPQELRLTALDAASFESALAAALR
jgi:protein-disulfide isomerase